MDGRQKVFISYSHDDTRWLQEMKQQLAVLEAEGLLSICEDTQLEAGTAWYERLHEAMLSAKLGLLLVSSSFLTSPFVRREEVPRLFSQHEEAGMKIYPLIVRPCPWERVQWLKRLQLRPQDSKNRVKPVSTFSGAARQQVLANVANEIAGLLESNA